MPSCEEDTDGILRVKTVVPMTKDGVNETQNNSDNELQLDNNKFNSKQADRECNYTMTSMPDDWVDVDDVM